MPVVLILGASSDMAIAIARKFASAGYQVQLAARKPHQLAPLQFDALNYSSHDAFLASLNPRPDVTVCVFGYLGDPIKARSDWNEANLIIQSNYSGAISILDKVANEYVAQKKG